MTDGIVSAPRIVVSGYYGFANTGDEAILEATVDGIHRFMPRAAVTVLSANPELTTLLTGAQSAPRYSPRDLWRLLRSGSLLVSGGGGLFQDVTSRRSLFYYLGILLFARLRGMRTMVYAQGLGPLQESLSRAMVLWVLRRVDRITVRDTGSQTLLKEIGLREGVVITADPAFCLKPATRERALQIMDAEAVDTGSPLLAICVRSWSEWTDVGQSSLIDALDQVSSQVGIIPVFVPMHHPDDVEMGASLAARLTCRSFVIQGHYAPSEIAALLGLCQGIVTMRLHALILGALSGAPSVALSYDPKVTAAAGQLGLEPILDVRSLQKDELIPAIERMLEKPAPRSEILAAAEANRQRAEENFRIMQELVGHEKV